MTTETAKAATLMQRTVAFLFDYLLIFVYLLLVLLLIGLPMLRFTPTFNERLGTNRVLGQLFGFIFATLPIGLYFVIGDASQAQGTWGKRKRGLQVTDGAGQPIGWQKSLLRTMLKLTPWEVAHTGIHQTGFSGAAPSTFALTCIGLSYALIGANLVSAWLSPTKQALYDRIAGTYVTRNNSVEN